MSLTSALIASSLRATSAGIVRAIRANKPAGCDLDRDSDQRRRMRALLDGAALSGATVTLAFVKNDDTLRYMACRPCYGVDSTARYYTVLDLERSQEAGRECFRRVCLDTVVAASVEFALQ